MLEIWWEKIWKKILNQHRIKINSKSHMMISHNFISILQKNYHKQILKQEILSEKMSDKNLKLKTFRINCLTNKNLTNMPLKFILPSNILIFKMIIPANVIFMTTVLKTISTFLNTLKMFMIYRCNLWTNCFDTKKQSQMCTNNFHKAYKCN